MNNNRLRSLRVINFRGIGRKHNQLPPHIFNLDADIVLLTGSNGFGKSSLMDAISLLLNGTLYDVEYKCKEGERILSGKRLIFHDKKNAEIRNIDSYACCLTELSRNEYKAVHESVPSIGIVWPRYISPRVRLKLTSFNQDTVKEIFDDYEENITDTVFGVLRPLPEVIERIINECRQNAQVCEQELNKRKQQISGSDIVDIDAERNRLITEFNSTWAEIREADSQWQKMPASLNILKSGNRSKTAEKEVIGFCKTAATVIDYKTNTNTVTVLEALRLLDDVLGVYWEKWMNQLQTTTTSEIEVLASEIAREIGDTNIEYRVVKNTDDSNYDNSNPPIFVTEEARILYQNTLEKIRQDVAGWQKEYQRLDNLLRHFSTDRPENPVSLENILCVLRDYSGRWSEVPNELLSGIDAKLKPVLDWLHQQAAIFESADSPAEHYANWRDGIILNQRSNQEMAGEGARLIQEMTRCLDLSKRLGKLMSTNIPLTEYLGQHENINAIELARQINNQFGNINPDNEMNKKIIKFRDVLAKWQALEGRAKQQQERLQREVGFQVYSKIVKRAIELLQREQKVKGIIRQSLSPSSDNVSSIISPLNAVLKRFRLVEGVLPITVKSDEKAGFMIRTANGLDPKSLSTGQAAQLALAWMLGLNNVFNEQIPHPVILLDDITTAVDMAQLPRVCALLRMAAYNSCQKQRRQIIISCHHEDLTNRLLEYLMPPSECKLRVIAFEGWDPDNGPQYREFNASPVTNESNEAKLFNDMLKLTNRDDSN